MAELTQEKLKLSLHYFPDTGKFHWLKKCAGYGKVAGSKAGNGYIQLMVDRHQYLAHRLAFLYMTGSIPEYVDHINGIRDDNRWSNLRACTQSQNLANIKGYGKSGHKNIKQDKYGWRCVFRYNKQLYDKYFPTLEAALSWRDSKTLELQGAFQNNSHKQG